MYTKLFGKILDSSIWLESDTTRIVWITLLAAMDEDGVARFSCAENLAHRARVTLCNVTDAIAILEAPDPKSSSPECNGRRIEKIPGGWLILNGPTYRQLATRQAVKDQTRERVRKYRERKSNATNVTDRYRNASSVYVSVSSSEKESAERKREVKPSKARAESLQQVLDYCTEAKIDSDDGEWFWDKCEGNGWKNNKVAILDWKATLRSWKRAGYLPSQKQAFTNNTQKPHDQPFRGHI